MALVTLFKYDISVFETSPIEVVPGRDTVPLKVGDANGAFNPKAVDIVVA
mgnify:CR=1 FL=1